MKSPSGNRPGSSRRPLVVAMEIVQRNGGLGRHEHPRAGHRRRRENCRGRGPRAPRGGDAVDHAGNGETGCQALRADGWDVVVLDWWLTPIIESAWPPPLPPPIDCNLSTNRKRKPKWRRCVDASIAVDPSAILTGSRTRPSDWGSNARFGPVEDRRNNRRLVTFTCTLFVLQI